MKFIPFKILMTISYMAYEPTSTAGARRPRELRAKGVNMIAPVETGEGGVELLGGDGLLKQHQAGDLSRTTGNLTPGSSYAGVGCSVRQPAAKASSAPKQQ